MPNRAYTSVHIRDFDETNMLAYLARFLASVPLSAGPLGFTELTIHAVDWNQPPVEECDLRTQSVTPAEIVELAREHHSNDVAYEISARWDLWIHEMESMSWKRKPEKLDISCYGPDFNDGMAGETGHF